MNMSNNKISHINNNTNNNHKDIIDNNKKNFDSMYLNNDEIQANEPLNVKLDLDTLRLT